MDLLKSIKHCEIQQNLQIFPWNEYSKLLLSKHMLLINNHSVLKYYLKNTYGILNITFHMCMHLITSKIYNWGVAVFRKCKNNLVVWRFYSVFFLWRKFTKYWPKFLLPFMNLPLTKLYFTFLKIYRYIFSLNICL